MIVKFTGCQCMNCTLILSIFAFLVSFEFFYGNFLITGAQPKAGTSHKMQTASVVFFNPTL